jgi:SRSO17 transposase
MWDLRRSHGSRAVLFRGGGHSVYGTEEIETVLRKAGKGYVLGAAANHVFRSWGKPQPVGGTATEIAQHLPESAWRRLSVGEGTRGPRLHD